MALINFLEFQSIFQGAKTMAIVGSSDSVLRYSNGKCIDACDLVVRFNRTKVDGLEDKVGSRTDILVVNDVNNLSKAPQVKELSNPRVVVCFIDRVGFNKSETHLKDFLDWVGDKDLFLCPRPDIAMIPVEKGTRSFSMGLYALGFLPYALSIKELFVTGFTFFGSVEGGAAHYSKKASFSGSLWHDADMELLVARQILSEYPFNVSLTDEVYSVLKEPKKNIQLFGGELQNKNAPKKSNLRLLANFFGYLLYKFTKVIMKSTFLLRRFAEYLRS